MDDSGFAQSRGDDDLFDDELIPIAPEEVQTITEQLQETSIVSDVPTVPSVSNRGASGGGRGADGDAGATTVQQTSSVPPSATESVDQSESQTVSEPAGEAGEESKADQQSTTETPRPQAVRGDRTATGGVKKVRLLMDNILPR